MRYGHAEGDDTITTRRRIVPRRTQAITRPRLTWRAFRVESLTLTGGVNQVFDLGNIGPAPSLADLGIIGDYTIRRVRWSFWLHNIDAESTVNVPLAVYMGMTVISADAFGSGVGASPDPLDDAADWWAYHVAPYFVTAAVATDADRRVYEWDERSMRRVNENSSVPALILSLAANETAQFAFAGRMLVSHGRG